MEDSRERVGVYGTLRRGGSQHRRMAGAEWIGACDVRARMYRIDWYPGVVLDDDAGCVRVEVYAVDARLLAELDAFEGPEYRRVRCRGADAPGFWMWEWLGACDEGQRIAGGDWLKNQEL